MDVHDTRSSTPGVILKTRTDWPTWFAVLRLHCSEKGIWDQVDPDAPTVRTIDEQEPVYLDFPTTPDAETLTDDEQDPI
jgi:hypothetical protein